MASHWREPKLASERNLTVVWRSTLPSLMLPLASRSIGSHITKITVRPRCRMGQQDWGKHPVHNGHQARFCVRLFFTLADFRHHR